MDSYLPVLTRLAADRRGVTAIVTAIALTVLLGFGGLAIDVAYWLNATRGMQAAADQAAYSAASAAGHAACASTTAVPQAIAITAARGYGASGTPVTAGGTTTVRDGKTTVTVNCNTTNSHFTVTISQIQPMWFASLFMSTAPTASAFATAQLAGDVSDLCVLALDGTVVSEDVTGSDANAVQAGGNASVNLGCGLAIDSSSTSALNVFGSSHLTATDLYIVGNQTSIDPGYVTVPPGKTYVNKTAIPDPYLGRHFPMPTTCNFTNRVIDDGNITLSPGTFCGGLQLGNHGASHIHLNPGVYYVVGGNLNIDSQAVIDQTAANATSDGVTFVLTGNTLGYTDYATVTINGGANVSLTAPTTGDFGGLAFFQDQRATASTVTNCGAGGIQNKFNGGANQKITGAIYFPNQAICFAGNASTGVTGPGRCTQVIARSFDFTGTSSLKLACDGTGISAITVPTPQLIK